MQTHLLSALKRGIVQLPSHVRAILIASISMLGLYFVFIFVVALLNAPLVSQIMEARGSFNFSCVGQECASTITRLLPYFEEHMLGIVLSIIALVLMMIFISLGLVMITLRSYDRFVVHLKDFFGAVLYLPRLFLVSLVNIAAIRLPVLALYSVVGASMETEGMQMGQMESGSLFLPILTFVVLLIVSLIWQVRFSFFAYFAIDRNQGAIQSLKSSFHATRGHALQLFGIFFLVGIIQGVLAMIPVIGLFAQAIQAVLITYIYRELMFADKSSEGFMGVPPQFPL